MAWLMHKAMQTSSLEGRCHVLRCINTDARVVKWLDLILLRVRDASITTYAPSSYFAAPPLIDLYRM